MTWLQKKKQQTSEELQNGAGTAENGAQSVESTKATQTTHRRNESAQSVTEAQEATEPTDLSDAPQEVKDEILKNAEALGEAEPDPEFLSFRAC